MESYVGKKFSRLLIIEELAADLKKFGKYSGERFLALCDCGRIKSVNKRAVLRGRVKSCGCLQPETASTHGLSKTRAYRVWMAMKQRCCNKDHWLYPRYGGRGIKICEKWKDVSVFCNWAKKNGIKQGLTIDRKNNDLGYFPENCRFVSKKKNLNNTSKTIYLDTPRGRLPLQEAAEFYGINDAVLYQRIKKLKWSHEKAVLTPLRVLKKRRKKQNAATG